MNISDFVQRTEMVIVDNGVDGKEEWFALQGGGVVCFSVSGVTGAKKLNVEFKCVYGVKSFRLNGNIYRSPGSTVLSFEKHQVAASVDWFNDTLRKYKTYVEMAERFVRDPSAGELIQNVND